jgi:hypothetical protein
MLLARANESRRKKVSAVQETGLLEQPVLLLEPPDAAGTRILRACSGEPVGLVRSRRLRSWWCFWCPAGLAVHEHDEEPLVFSIRRGLTIPPCREVLDAEGELVGTVAEPWLLDRWKQPLVDIRRLPEGKGVFMTVPGDELAAWATVGGKFRLEVRELARADPFLKMLILAGLLHVAMAHGKG